MTLTRKDGAATALTGLVVLAFLAARRLDRRSMGRGDGCDTPVATRLHLTQAVAHE